MDDWYFKYIKNIFYIHQYLILFATTSMSCRALVLRHNPSPAALATRDSQHGNKYNVHGDKLGFEVFRVGRGATFRENREH